MTTMTTGHGGSYAPTATVLSFRGRPAPTRAGREPAGGNVRLTRRGRAVLVLALLAGLLVGGFAFGTVSSSHAAGTSTRSVVVQPGDTVWAIAARVAPHRDTREVAAQLERTNHLAGATVQVGQRLTVPS